jgi:hypothetical protein
MATDATIGYGSIFAYGDSGSPEVFSALAEVVSITPPQLVRDTVDATHMASPQKWREFVPGLKDGGEVSLEMNFIPGNSDWDFLFLAFNQETVRNYRITFPNAESWTFAAYCTGIEAAVPLDDKMSATATFKVSGPPAFATM